MPVLLFRLGGSGERQQDRGLGPVRADLAVAMGFSGPSFFLVFRGCVFSSSSSSSGDVVVHSLVKRRPLRFIVSVLASEFVFGDVVEWHRPPTRILRRTASDAGLRGNFQANPIIPCSNCRSGRFCFQISRAQFAVLGVSVLWAFSRSDCRSGLPRAQVALPGL